MSDYDCPGDATVTDVEPIGMPRRTMQKSPCQRALDSRNSDNTPREPSPFHSTNVGFNQAFKRLAVNEYRSTVVEIVPHRDLYNTGQIIGYDLNLDDGNKALHVKYTDPWGVEIAPYVGEPFRDRFDRRVGKWLVWWRTGDPVTILSVVVLEPMQPKVEKRTFEGDIWSEKPMTGLPPIPGKTVRDRLQDVAADREARKHADWIDDPDLLNKFHKRWNDIYNERVAKAGAPAGQATAYRHAWQKRQLGTEHLKDSGWNNTAKALLDALIGALDFDYPFPKVENAPEAAQAAENDSPAIGIPETVNDASAPAAPRSETAPVALKAQQEKTSNMAEPIAAGVEIDKAEFRRQRTIKVSGQDYLKAGDRVILFRSDHPDWTIETDAIACSIDFAVFKATIKDATGKVVSSGHGYCTPDLAKKVSGRFVEKAETAAIARALALAGYGTDDTLDDSDYISDSPVQKAA